MKVKEFINQLKKVNPEYNIVVRDNGLLYEPFLMLNEHSNKVIVSSDI